MNSSASLILIRHSVPDPDPAVPPNQWPLSDEGRRRCLPLARKLAPYQPAAIVSSLEAKARETAQLVAAHLGLPCAPAPNLHEHERDAGWHDRATFEALIAGLFRWPDELVFGRETARQAADRFDVAIQGVLDRQPHATAAVVTHGSVLCLFLQRHAGLAPFALWRRLGLPALVVLDRAGFRFRELVASVEDEHDHQMG